MSGRDRSARPRMTEGSAWAVDMVGGAEVEAWFKGGSSMKRTEELRLFELPLDILEGRDEAELCRARQHG